MKKKVIKTLITATALANGLPVENMSAQTIVEETKEEEVELEKPIRRNKRTKRQTSTTATPPSLLQLSTRVNIGEIEVNDITHITQRLREINHQLISREDFLNNIEFDSITTTNAVIHTTIDIPFVATPDAENAQAIPEIKFVITFTAQRLTLSSMLRNTDLGELPDNSGITVMNRLWELNPELRRNWRVIIFVDERFIEQNRMNLRISDIQANPKAFLEVLSGNFIFDCDINVNFTARRLMLGTFLRNTDLGELPDVREETILNRIVQLNPNIDRNDISINSIRILEGEEWSTFIKITTVGQNRYVDNVGISVFFILSNNKNKSVTSGHTPSVSSSTTTTPPPSGGSGVVPSTSGQSSSAATSSRTRTQHNNQSTNSNRRSQKPKCAVLQKQIIDQKLLNIYQTTSTDIKNHARKKLKAVYGKHFTDASWEQFEKFVELHKYGMVFIEANNNNKTSEYSVKGVSTTGAITIPSGYLTMKTVTATTKTVAITEEAVPLLEISEEGAVVIGEMAVEEGAAVMAGGSVLGPVGWVVGGVIIVGGVAYLVYNWDHAHNADVNSDGQYNQIEKYYLFMNSTAPAYTESSKLKLGITTNMWMQLAQIYQNNKDDYLTFEKNILNEIEKFPRFKNDFTNVISDENIKTLIKVMYDNFAQINIFYMMTNQHGWKIVTNAVGNYFEIEPE